MKRLSLVLVALLTLTVALQAQTSPDPFGVLENEIQQIEQVQFNNPVATGADIVYIDQVEMRFVPEVVKESQVLPVSAYRSYDWNINPYEKEPVLIQPCPLILSYIESNRQTGRSPPLYIIASSSGGIPF